MSEHAQTNLNGRRNLLLMELRQAEIQRAWMLKGLAACFLIAVFFFVLYFITVAGINRNSSGMILYLLLAIISAGVAIFMFLSYSRTQKQIQAIQQQLCSLGYGPANQAPRAALFCKNCGKPLVGTKLFCQSCGAKQRY